MAANLKHFACNNQEYERMTTNAVIDERTLNELYLRTFQLILQKSEPWTMMSCYNQVNGQWVHANEYMMKKLREDWGWQGMLMSDAFAVHYEEDKVQGHKRGLDVELAEESCHLDLLKNAYNRGEITDAELSLDRRAFEMWSPARHRWVAEAGDYLMEVGRSSRDILLSATVHLDSDEAMRRYSPRTQIGHFAMDPKIGEALRGKDDSLLEFLDLEHNPILPLCLAIPFGQFGELDLGKGTLPRELIQQVADKLNEGKK